MRDRRGLVGLPALVGRPIVRSSPKFRTGGVRLVPLVSLTALTLALMLLMLSQQEELMMRAAAVDGDELDASTTTTTTTSAVKTISGIIIHRPLAEEWHDPVLFQSEAKETANETRNDDDDDDDENGGAKKGFINRKRRKKRLEMQQRCPFSLINRRPGMPKSEMAVVYTHVPKAGGMSVQKLLERLAEQKGLRYYRFDSANVRGSSSLCPNARVPVAYDVFAGHRGFGFCEELERRRDIFAFTVLRDPIRRFVSHFDYDLNTPLSNNHDKATRAFGRKDLSALVMKFARTEEMMEDGEKIMRYYCSAQTRFMCGYGCMGPAAQNGSFDAAAALDRALFNLRNRTQSVGILEEFDDLLLQLRVHLPWIPSSAKSWPHDNARPGTAPRKSKLSREASEVVRGWCRNEYVLYNEAVRIAREKTAEAKICLGEA